MRKPKALIRLKKKGYIKMANVREGKKNGAADLGITPLHIAPLSGIIIILHKHCWANRGKAAL